MNSLFDFTIDLYHQFNMLINSEVLEEFRSLQTNWQRIDFAYNYLTPNVSDDSNESFISKRIEKSNITSLKLREQGNQLYRIKKNLEAVLLYTESIAYAENDSANLGLAYGNRSAALFEKGYYKECLEDINRALESNYPIHLKAKLLSRQERANVLLMKNPTKSFCYYDPPPDIVNKHPRISAAADCVELNRNESFGTHVIATRHIKAGEIISVEKPLSCGVAKESIYLHCHECLELCYDMIPCQKCATALYCSETCRTSAFINYHRYECDIGSLIRKDVLYIKSTLLYAMEYKYLQENDRAGDDEIYLSDTRNKMYYLGSNENVSNNPHVFISAAIAGDIFRCLKTRTNFVQEKGLDENVLKEIIFRYILIEITNCLGINKSNFSSETLLASSNLILVGLAIYAFSSRYSHSCAPNCFRCLHGTTLVFRALRDISEGEQCTISYRWNYYETTLAARQKQIEMSYFFTCKCIACENVWPTYVADSSAQEDIVQTIVNAIMRSERSRSSVLLSTYKLFEKLKGPVTGITSVDIGEMIDCCFHLQRLMVEPCRALVFIKQTIVRLFSLSENKCIL